MSFYAKAWCRANIVTIEPTRVYVSQSGHGGVDPGRGLGPSMPRIRPGVGSIFSLYTVMIQSFRTDRSGQTVQTQIRLLLEEQSDQGLHCLLFHLHLLDEIP